jgi:hypothetical protein
MVIEFGIGIVGGCACTYCFRQHCGVNFRHDAMGRWVKIYPFQLVYLPGCPGCGLKADLEHTEAGGLNERTW